MDDKTPAQVTPTAVSTDPVQKQADTFYPEKTEATKTAEVKTVETPVETKTEAKPTEEAKPVSEYKLKLPENSLLNAKAIEEVTAFAKEKGLSPEQAQLTLERESNAVVAFAEAQQNQMELKKTEWYEAAKSDKEIGGDIFAESAEMAKRVVNKYGSDAFKEELERSGLGNHPELLRVFARIGKAMQSDTLVRPGSMASSSKPIEQIFYPDNQ